MKLLVGGILALDNLKTPHASGEAIVGGAGVYASVAASFFTQPGLVGPAGSDFPEAALEVLRERGVAVRVVLTRAATEFVTPLSVGALTNERVLTSLFDLSDEHGKRPPGYPRRQPE